MFHDGEAKVAKGPGNPGEPQICVPETIGCRECECHDNIKVCYENVWCPPDQTASPIAMDM